MSKSAAVGHSPACRASKNAMEPSLEDETLQKSSPSQREKKRMAIDFEHSASNSKAATKLVKGMQHDIVFTLERFVDWGSLAFFVSLPCKK